MTAPRQNARSVSTIKCAGPGCGRLRHDASHWLVLRVGRHSFSCRPYSVHRHLSSTDLPACGQGCALKIFDRFTSALQLRRCAA
jgi:hypothetical protein